VPQSIGHHLLGHVFLLVRQVHGYLAYTADRDAGAEKVHHKVVQAHDAHELSFAKEPVETGRWIFLVELEKAFS
jgi:hypothetical protein